MIEDSANKDIQYLQKLSVTHLATRVYAAGLHFHVFELIGDDCKTAAEIAEAAGASVRGMRMLLDCLTSLLLLKKSQQGYSLTSISLRYLRKSSRDYMGHMWESGQNLESWNYLNEAIRTGQPARKFGTQEQEGASFSGLVRSLNVVNSKAAENAALVLGAGTTYNGMTVLDLACGSGVWGIAIAQADPQSRIVAHDLPAVLEISKEFVNLHNVVEQFTYLPGDLREVDFGESLFDLVIAGNILHSEGERRSRELLPRLHRALRNGGRIAIVEIIPDEQRTGPQGSMLLALAMLMDTEDGDLFTLAEYESWLMNAGFERFATADIGSHSPLIIAHRAS